MKTTPAQLMKALRRRDLQGAFFRAHGKTTNDWIKEQGLKSTDAVRAKALSRKMAEAACRAEEREAEEHAVALGKALLIASDQCTKA